MRLSRFSFLPWAVSGAAVLLAGLMLVASLYSARQSFLGCAGFVVMLLSLWVIFEQLSNVSEVFRRHEIRFLMLACFMLHMFMVLLLPSLGQNGLAAAWDSRAAVLAMESGSVCFKHAVRNQYWCNYEILLSTLGTVLLPKVYIGQMLNALCCVAVLWPIHRITLEIAGAGIARLAVLLAGTSPALLMYSTLLTSEFLSATFLFFAAYFFLRAMKEDRSWRSILRMAFLCGMLLSISDLFKTITIIFKVAVLFFVLMQAVRVNSLATLKRGVVVVVIVLATFGVIRPCAQAAFAEIANEPGLTSTDSEVSGILYELVLGLNLKSEGMFDGQLAKTLLSLPEGGRKKLAKEIVARDWRSYPMLMVRKFVNIHGSHANAHGAVSNFSLTFREYPLKSGGRDFTPCWVRPLSDNGMLLFRFLFFLGAVGLLSMTRSASWQILAPGLFAMFVVLEFSVVEQLIEGHGRYKTAIYPFYFMTIPYICVWFEKDNPVYVRLVRWAGVLLSKLKRRGDEC